MLPKPLPSRLWPSGQIMPPGGHPCNRKIGAMNSVIRGCALLLIALIGWTEPALARSYLDCLTKKVVIVDAQGGVLRPAVELAYVNSRFAGRARRTYRREQR